MIKHTCYLKGIVRNQGKGRYGMGVELFRLDAAKEEDVELTEDEREAIGDDEQSSVAIMRLYENIGEDFFTGGGITAAGFAEQLDALGDIKKLNLHINCLGGDTHTAQAIYNILADHGSRKTSYIDGIAASAATIVACGANEVVARRNTNYMIHNPWTIAMGNSGDLREAAEVLDKITDPIVGVYRQQVRGKIDEGKIRSLMDAETWMTAEEALEYGFVDRVCGKVKAISSALAGRVLVNGKVYNLGKYQYKNTPKYPKTKEEPKVEEPKAKIITTISYIEKPEEGEKPMTTDEIRTQYPDLYNSIRAEAEIAERGRLSDLDAMSAPGLEQLIATAKADGRRPEQIAVEACAILKASTTQLAQVNALQRDASTIRGIPASDAPTTKKAVAESKQQKGIRLMSAAYADVAARRHKNPLQTKGNHVTSYTN